MSNLTIPKRLQTKKEEFLYQIDHCFTLKGKGSVLTGTVVQGSIETNEVLEIAKINQVRKIKSM
jgi:selenocysteine-specific elongation factor